MSMFVSAWVNHCISYQTWRQRAACLTAGAMLLATGNLLAQDVGFIGLLKGRHYEQNAPGIVTLAQLNPSEGQAPFLFTAMVQGALPNVLGEGTLELPDHSMVNLYYDPERQILGDDYLSETPLYLDINRPNGDYTLSFVTTNDGPGSVTLSLTGDDYPAAPPVITNFTALQAITNTALPVTIQWSTIPGATSGDYVQLLIRGPGNMQWQSIAFGQPGALCGTNTSATLPPNTLSPGLSYHVELMVARAVDSDLSAAMAVAAYFVQTDFTINTTPLYASFDQACPGNGAWDVARNSVISFRFTQPMNPGFMSVNWSGTGLDPDNFSYSWNDGKRVLMCAYSGNLPAGSDLFWTLNLGGFKDASGHALAGTANGSFRTASGMPLTGDMAKSFLMKTRYYQQQGSTPESLGLFAAEASVEMTGFNRFRQPATVAVSNHVYKLSADDWDPALKLEVSLSSQAQVDTFFPNGSYTFALPQLSGGTNTFSLDLGSVEDYPATPTVTNLKELQNIDSSNDTVIAWITLSGFSTYPAEGSSIIEVYICDDEDGDDMYSFSPGDLSITASGITIPANTLWPGRAYRVELIFSNIKDWNFIDQDHFSAAGFSAITEFAIHTAGTPILPKLNIASQAGGMEVSFEGGEPNRHYVAETSSDLQRWISQFEVTADAFATMMSQQDSDAQYLSSRFYRLRDWTNADGFVQPPVSIQGTVWTDSSHTTPLAGAQVGTSLDGQVTQTDENGRFFLETETIHTGVGLSYSIGINKGRLVRTYGPYEWGHHPRNQIFEMN